MMNEHNLISDEEFTSFLNKLGVETYKLSFEWMHNDPEIAGVLRWMCSSLDSCNALTAREECRYAELQRKNMLLSSEELDVSLKTILKQHQGLPLPGDQEALEDVQLNIQMLSERVKLLDKQNDVTEDLIRKNELAKEELSRQITKLHAEETQCKEDEETAAKESMELAKEVESIKERIIDVVGDTLEKYATCDGDKEKSQKFLVFGPFDKYRQSQALFNSHFDLYVTRNFSQKQNQTKQMSELKCALNEAKDLEERLTDAVISYIETKVSLSGQQAKLLPDDDYDNLSDDEIEIQLVELQTATELIEQEEAILEQQIQDTTKLFVEKRTALAVDIALRSALSVREAMYTKLCWLNGITERALLLDNSLYYLMRYSLRSVSDLVQFAQDLSQYVVEEQAAVASRIESMNSISAEQDARLQRVKSNDPLLAILCKILDLEPNSDLMSVVKCCGDLDKDICNLKERLANVLQCKEQRIRDFVLSHEPLKSILWDGCTKQPNIQNRAVSSLMVRLKREMDSTEQRIVNIGSSLQAAKNNDKYNLRKLWQWFLTDEAKLLSELKKAQARSYS